MSDSDHAKGGLLSAELAVAMAEIFSHVVGGPAMKAFWYHFAILFEALFILTAVDAGTRAGRFMLQDLIALVVPAFKHSDSHMPGIIATALCVAAWGFFLYQGVTDPLGGVNTLWPVFGISNQMLAAIALSAWGLSSGAGVHAVWQVMGLELVLYHNKLHKFFYRTLHDEIFAWSVRFSHGTGCLLNFRRLFSK